MASPKTAVSFPCRIWRWHCTEEATKKVQKNFYTFFQVVFVRYTIYDINNQSKNETSFAVRKLMMVDSALEGVCMLKQIRYFHSVVYHKSFSLAAEECHISQSAISQHIQALERELGVTLLKRENRRFSLTPAGEHFYRQSLLFMADFDRLCKETKRNLLSIP